MKISSTLVFWWHKLAQKGSGCQARADVYGKFLQASSCCCCNAVAKDYLYGLPIPSHHLFFGTQSTFASEQNSQLRKGAAFQPSTWAHWWFLVATSTKTSWWLQPHWKILVKMEILPNFRGENSKNVWSFTTQKRSIDTVMATRNPGKTRTSWGNGSWNPIIYQVFLKRSRWWTLGFLFSINIEIPFWRCDDLLVGPAKLVK